MIFKVVPSVFVLLSFYSVRCFVIQSENPKQLQNEGCSSVFCSDSKIDNMYDNSKFLLSEIELLLQDLRDHKITHELEQEHNRKLDNEMKYITDKDFIRILYSDNEGEDDEYDNEMNITEPVPFVHVHFYDDLNKTNHQDNVESLNDLKNEQDSNSSEVSTEDEEEIDFALSRLDEIQEDQNNKEHNMKYTPKRYLR